MISLPHIHKVLEDCQSKQNGIISTRITKTSKYGTTTTQYKAKPPQPNTTEPTMLTASYVVDYTNIVHLGYLVTPVVAFGYYYVKRKSGGSLREKIIHETEIIIFKEFAEENKTSAKEIRKVIDALLEEGILKGSYGIHNETFILEKTIKEAMKRDMKRKE